MYTPDIERSVAVIRRNVLWDFIIITAFPACRPTSASER